jgi:hypothetical protein
MILFFHVIHKSFTFLMSYDSTHTHFPLNIYSFIHSSPKISFHAGKFLTPATTLSFPMATLTSSFSFSTLTQSSQNKQLTFSSTRFLSSDSDTVRFRFSLSSNYVGVRTSNSISKMVVRCSSSVSGLEIKGITFNELVLTFFFSLELMF